MADRIDLDNSLNPAISEDPGTNSLKSRIEMDYAEIKEPDSSQNLPDVENQEKFQEKTGLKKFMDEDGIPYFIIEELFVPKLKDFAWGILEGLGDLILDSIRNVIFPGDKRSRSFSSSKRRDYTSYKEAYRKREGTYKSNSAPWDVDRNSLSDPRFVDNPSSVIFRNRESAEEALEKCLGIISLEGFCSVGQFYQMDEVNKPTTYTDYEWGWSSLRKAIVIDDPYGWFIKFPPVVRNRH